MPDELQPLPFPDKGLDLSQPLSAQPPRTTPIGQNVRWFEVLTQRGRGGARPGIIKYPVGIVGKSALIQELAEVVSTSATALGGAVGADGSLGPDGGPAWPGGWGWITPQGSVPGLGGFQPGAPAPNPNPATGVSNQPAGQNPPGQEDSSLDNFLGLTVGGSASIGT